VSSRADLSRTVASFVALFLTAITTSAVAREFHAPDARNEDDPIIPARHDTGRLIAERGGRNPAATAPIERIRKVE
jgi:hypothetical protein